MTSRIAQLAMVATAFAGTLVGQVRIDGRLLEQRGAQLSPIPHCTVFAQSIDSGPLVGEYPDDQGRFVLEFPPDSRVSVGTICPGYSVGKINGRSTPPLTYDCSQPGPCASVEMTLEPLAVVEGQVVSSWGAAVEGVHVVLRQGSGRRSRQHATQSDDRGYFRLNHVRPGRYELEPMTQRPIAQGLSWEGRVQPIEVSAGDVVSGVQVQLSLVEPVEMSGRIQGLPPDTKQVQLMVSRRDGRFATTQVVPVDESGRFQVRGLQPGAYQFRMLDPGSTERSMVNLGAAELRPGAGEATLTMQQPARLVGVIHPEWPERDDPPPMENRPIFLRLQSEEGDAGAIHARPPDYRFEVRDLFPGTYKVTADGAGGHVLQRIGADEWGPVEPVVVAEGQTVELELKVRFEVGSLTVFVRPPEGAAPSEHYVVALRNEERGTMVFPTDQNGKLVMRYISRGDYEIGAWQELTREQADDPEFWEQAGDAVRKFRHEEGVDMEITLTAAP